MSEPRFKGGKFLNRVRIKGTLTADAPFHIGNGGYTERPGMKEKDKGGKDGAPLKIAAVATDASGQAYIPGSVLRGGLRNHLAERYLAPMGAPPVSDVLKSLFGGIGNDGNEGKVEVEDAWCTTKVDTPSSLRLSGWSKERMTYVATSVAIDPASKTARDRMLHNFELVPEGADFSVAISAQNLEEEELELLLDLLDGFNDKEDPVTLGAMGKHGFGRFIFGFRKVWRLDSGKLGEWETKAMSSGKAGYDLIEDKDFGWTRDMLLEEKKKVPAKKKCGILHKEEWEITLETPLVVRNRHHSGWRKSDGKTRNAEMGYKWEPTKEDLDPNSGQYGELQELHFRLRLEKDSAGKVYAKPDYVVPESSVRGALRSWTVTHLLPRDWWDIEMRLKESKWIDLESGKKDDLKFLDPIRDLFGFAIEGEDDEVTSRYTQAGMLSVQVKSFAGTGKELRDAQGIWNSTDAAGSPGNARRHVKPRNPLDRVSHAARKGGLHNTLEFAKGEKFMVTLEVKQLAGGRPVTGAEPPKPTEVVVFSGGSGPGTAVTFKALFEKWKEEINAGMIPFGGLTSVGRGRVKVTELKDEAGKGQEVSDAKR